MTLTPTITPELAARLRQALTSTADELFSVVQDPSPEVLRALLKNRSLNDEHLLSLLKRRDLPEDLLKAIFQLEQTNVSHRLKVALTSHPHTPGAVVLALLPHLHLFELLNISLLAGPSPDQKLAAERVIIQRLSVTPLGNKITLARRGTPTLVGELLKHTEPEVMNACLDSPRLKEISIIQYLNGPKVTADTISRIARHPKWKNSPNIKLAILKNPQTPSIWFVHFLPQLPTVEKKNLLRSTRLSSSQRELIAENLQRHGHSANRKD